MKKIVFSALAVICNLQILSAQDTWKERAAFFRVFDPALQAAINKNTGPILENFDEIETKCFDFIRNAREKFGSGNKEMNRNLTLLGEQMTLIDIIINTTKRFNAETIYGELVILHNRYRKIILKDEEPLISKELLKRFQKEEKSYLAKRKEIYSANGWRL